MTIKHIYLDISYSSEDIKSHVNLTEEVFGTILSKTIRDLGLVEKSKLMTLDKDIDVSVSVYITTDIEIQQLNKEYRGKDKSTDVLSFAIFQESEMPLCVGGGSIELGDIVISQETATIQAEKRGHSLVDEIIFLFTHGVLHLLGYDDQDEDGYNEMIDCQALVLEGIITNNTL